MLFSKLRALLLESSRRNCGILEEDTRLCPQRRSRRGTRGTRRCGSLNRLRAKLYVVPVRTPLLVHHVNGWFVQLVMHRAMQLWRLSGSKGRRGGRKILRQLEATSFLTEVVVSIVHDTCEHVSWCLILGSRARGGRTRVAQNARNPISDRFLRGFGSPPRLLPASHW